MIRVGVVGYGYWGPNLVRNFAENAKSEVVAVCDLSPERLKLASRRQPSLFTTTSYREMLARPDIDLVCIATPLAHHHALAMEALKSGRHILIEKPMCQSVAQSLEIAEEADKRRLVAAVDHTYLFNGAVRCIKQNIDRGELGKLYYYDSTRINLGLFQADSSVIWDLAVHDLSILDLLLSEAPCAVSATGTTHVSGAPENVAFLTLSYASGFIAHVNVNWLAPVKIRQTLVAGSKRMIVFDEVQPTEKIKIYDRGIVVTENADQIYKALVSYRTGDIHSPKLDEREALAVEVDELLDCIAANRQPVNNAAMGLRIVTLLEAAELSLRSAGRPIELATTLEGKRATA